MAVSLALRGHASISPRTRERVKSAARTLGYAPDAALATMMTRMRRGPAPGETAALAVLNLSAWPDLLEERTNFRRFVAGAAARVKELGFTLDSLWAGDPAMSAQRLRGILAARGVQGVLVAWIEGELKAPDPRQFFGGPMVQLGRKLAGLDCDYVSDDQFSTARRAGMRLVRMGARRLGLVIGEADRVVDHRYSGGFHSLRSVLPEVDLLAPFNPDRAGPEDVWAWVKRERPGGVLVHDPRVAGWLKPLEARTRPAPRVALLNWSKDSPGVQGMRQQSERIGAIAVDRLVARIRFPGMEAGAAQGIFVESEWKAAEAR